MTLSMFCFSLLCDIGAICGEERERTVSGPGARVYWVSTCDKRLRVRSVHSEWESLSKAAWSPSQRGWIAAAVRLLAYDSWVTADSCDTASGLALSSQSRSNYQVKTTYDVTLTAVQARPNATDTLHELVVSHNTGWHCNTDTEWVWHLLQGVISARDTSRDDGVEESKWWTVVTLSLVGQNTGSTHDTDQYRVTSSEWPHEPEHWWPQWRPAPASPPSPWPRLPRPRPSRPVKMHYWRLNQFEIGTAAGCLRAQSHARLRRALSSQSCGQDNGFPRSPQQVPQIQTLVPLLELCDGVSGGLVAVRQGRGHWLGAHRLESPSSASPAKRKMFNLNFFVEIDNSLRFHFLSSDGTKLTTKLKFSDNDFVVCKECQYFTWQTSYSFLCCE